MNCHATSTLAGDLAEVNAIKKIFKCTSEMKMNGTKVCTTKPLIEMHYCFNIATIYNDIVN